MTAPKSFRILKPGGHLGVTDIVAEDHLSLTTIDVTPTRRRRGHASAIITATKPPS